MSSLHDKPRVKAGGPGTPVLRLILAAFLVLVSASSGKPQSDWRKGMTVFRIGIVGSLPSNASAVEKAYTLALGLPAVLASFEDYRSLIEAQAGGRIQYGVYTAGAYATAELACACVSPIVAPVGANGGLGIRSVLIVRQGLPFEVDKLSRYRIATAGPRDIAGRLLPIAELMLDGKRLTGGEPFLIDAGSPSAALAMFVAGQADAVFGWVETGRDRTPLAGSGTLEDLAEAGLSHEALSIVWTSDLLRHGPHALSRDLDPEVRRRLVPFLVGLKDADPDIFDALEAAHGGGFATVQEADYQSALDAVKSASGDGG